MIEAKKIEKRLRIIPLLLLAVALVFASLTPLMPARAAIEIAPMEAEEGSPTAGPMQIEFTSSDTWTVPAGTTEVEVLVVAGGGGGGSHYGAGGGAGGLVSHSGYSVTPGSNITITIGAGGAGASSGDPGAAGTDGNNSVFGSITALGGGGGGFKASAGRSGGSGGGGGNDGGSNAGGSGTQGDSGGGTGYGNDGGASNGNAGGGGGAGAVGSSPNGGAGKDYSGDFGLAVGDSGWFAGGGAGWNGGTGGQGGGGGYGVIGTANTGGGGGAWNGAATGTGGSGVVIIRFDAEYSSSRREFTVDAGGNTSGTIAVTNDSTTVTGTSTYFEAWLRYDHIQMPSDDWYQIDYVANDTTLLLSLPYRDANAIGESYSMRHVAYVLPITVHYGSGTDSGDDVYLTDCYVDFTDIYFTEEDHTTLIPYYRFSYTDSDQAVFYVRFPSVEGTDVFNIHWGDPSGQVIPPMGPFPNLSSATLDDYNVGSGPVYDSVTALWWMVVESKDTVWDLHLANSTTLWGGTWNVNATPAITEAGYNSRGGGYLVKFGSYWYIYYRRCDTNHNPDWSQIYARRCSTVNGTYSSTGIQNPLLDRGSAGEWDDLRVSHPSVFEYAGGFRMLFSGSAGPSPGHADDLGGMGIADSNYANTTFTKISNLPVIARSNEAGHWNSGTQDGTDPTLLTIGDTYYVGHVATKGTGALANPFISKTTDFELFWVARHPIMVPGDSGDIDDVHIQRGDIVTDGDYYYYTYGAYNGDGDVPGSYGICITRQYRYTDDYGFPPEQVFDLWDDFSASALDGHKWSIAAGTPTVPGGILKLNSLNESVFSHAVFARGTRFEANMTIVHTVNHHAGYYDSGVGNIDFKGDSPNANKYNARTWITDWETTDLGDTHTGYHVWKMLRDGHTDVEFLVDDSSEATHSTKVPPMPMPILLKGQTTAALVDYVFVIPYCEPDLSITEWTVVGGPKPIGIGPNMIF